jgi:hypothetical protein
MWTHVKNIAVAVCRGTWAMVLAFVYLFTKDIPRWVGERYGGKEIPRLLRDAYMSLFLIFIAPIAAFVWLVLIVLSLVLVGVLVCVAGPQWLYRAASMKLFRQHETIPPA